MRIGVDLDGVVYDFISAMRDWMNQPSLPDPDRWNIWECWNMQEHEWEALLRSAVLDGVFEKGEAYPGAIAALRRFVRSGHSIHLVTARRPEAVPSTVRWLENNGISYSSLTFSGDKALLPVDVFIEDNQDTVAELRSTGTQAYLIRRPWNATSTLPYINTWEDFEEICRGLDNVKGNPKLVEWVQTVMTGGAKNVQGGEVRETSETGGSKGSKPEQYSLLPPDALAEVARVYAFGADKYTERNGDGEIVKDGRNNWMLGYKWHLSYDALQRHANQFWGGQTYDDDSGLHHLAHAVFHCLTLIHYGADIDRYARFDNRPVNQGPP